MRWEVLLPLIKLYLWTARRAIGRCHALKQLLSVRRTDGFLCAIPSRAREKLLCIYLMILDDRIGNYTSGFDVVRKCIDAEATSVRNAERPRKSRTILC
jgi:hypothetical protein